MSMDSDVGVRVAALCLDRKGRPAPPLICSTAVRAALLADLALAGRLEETADSIALDDSPTGSPPADALLREVTAHPGTVLDGWLERPRPTLRDVAEDAVRTGRWELRRGVHLAPRFTVLDVEQVAADLARDPASDTRGWTPSDAAVTAIAVPVGLLGAARTQGGAGYRTESVPDEVFAAAGPLRWLLPGLVDHLTEARRRYSLQGSALGGGGATPY